MGSYNDIRFGQTAEAYNKIGIDASRAVAALSQIPISIHCWQGDDVAGFEGAALSGGGIAVTGNYPGRARNHKELMDDFARALSYIPGKHRLNLHASYAVTDGKNIDRNALEPKHFAKWVDFAKAHGLALDFNPTFFSHPKAEIATLSSYDDDIRKFWIYHGIACLKIAEYFATRLGGYSLLNIWIPDGAKDTPADRQTPRQLLKNSLDTILAAGYDKNKVLVSVESKVFGIGLESFTVGSHEFYMNYAASRGILCLIDSGHFHPTENVADKISSMLAFFDKVALHVTRPVRWDSDHVVLFDDEMRAIAAEIIKHGTDRVLLGLDFFDASINRIAAWVLGVRSAQKALLYALLTPHEKMAMLQKEGRQTELLILQEELKTQPFGDVWDYFCRVNNVPLESEWFEGVKKYENEVLLNRC
jgi:L-rhamnose isomerase